jgi:hypothetical protein
VLLRLRRSSGLGLIGSLAAMDDLVTPLGVFRERRPEELELDLIAGQRDIKLPQPRSREIEGRENALTGLFQLGHTAVHVRR